MRVLRARVIAAAPVFYHGGLRVLIKQFRATHVRVPDPLRPGRHAMEERLIPTGATSISHDGKTYDADRNGWFDLPHEVGEEMLKGHYPRGERFHTDAEIGEHVRFGSVEADELPDAPRGASKRRSAE